MAIFYQKKENGRIKGIIFAINRKDRILIDVKEMVIKKIYYGESEISA